MWRYIPTEELFHAGVKGMKWGYNDGKKNGNRVAEGYELYDPRWSVVTAMNGHASGSTAKKVAAPSATSKPAVNAGAQSKKPKTMTVTRDGVTRTFVQKPDGTYMVAPTNTATTNAKTVKVSNSGKAASTANTTKISKATQLEKHDPGPSPFGEKASYKADNYTTKVEQPAKPAESTKSEAKLNTVTKTAPKTNTAANAAPRTNTLTQITNKPNAGAKLKTAAKKTEEISPIDPNWSIVTAKSGPGTAGTNAKAVKSSTSTTKTSASDKGKAYTESASLWEKLKSLDLFKKKK